MEFAEKIATCNAERRRKPVDMNQGKGPCGKEYVIVTPVKDEEKTIENTILAVLAQRLLPVEWVVIDDCSSDNTGKIVQNYQNKFSLINYVHVNNVQIKEISARIAYLVNFGISQITANRFRFILKLDGDVDFDNDFVDTILEEFVSNPNLGIASGLVDFKGKRETNPDITLTRGAAKFYRKECWQDIGGVYLSRGWDTVDNYAAQYYGWQTRSFDVYFRHCKEEGKRSGTLRWHYWTGLYNGRIPYHPLYFVLKLLKHVARRPFFFGSAVQLYGFILAAYIRKERPFPEEISAYIRQMQLKKLFEIVRGR